MARKKLSHIGWQAKKATRYYGRYVYASVVTSLMQRKIDFYFKSLYSDSHKFFALMREIIFNVTRVATVIVNVPNGVERCSRNLHKLFS